MPLYSIRERHRLYVGQTTRLMIKAEAAPTISYPDRSNYIASDICITMAGRSHDRDLFNILTTGPVRQKSVPRATALDMCIREGQEYKRDRPVKAGAWSNFLDLSSADFPSHMARLRAEFYCFV